MTSSSDVIKAKNFRISGRVQGVCYRMATVEQARQLGLTGWVKNLPDGGVEVYACGSVADLATLQRWLQQGPPMARVEQVQAEDAQVDEYREFSISY